MEVGELLWRSSAVGEDDEAGAAVPEEDLSRAPEEFWSAKSEEPAAAGKKWARKPASGSGMIDWRWRLRMELGAEP